MPHTFLPLALALLVAASPVLAGNPAPKDRYGFDVDVVLSSQAAATLTARHEGLFLFASYAGAPKKWATKYADQSGQIDLVGRSVGMNVPGRSGLIHFKGPAIDAKRLAMIQGPVLVNLNVASARKSGPDNLLDCDFIDGKLADVRKHSPITLHCGLIGESPATAVKP